jgi:hypothetical protein
MIADGHSSTFAGPWPGFFMPGALLLPAAVCKSNAGLHAKACFQEEPDPAIAI